MRHSHLSDLFLHYSARSSQVVDDEGPRELSPRSSRQTQPSGYLASAELSAAPAPARVPRRPTRGALKHSAAAAAQQPPPAEHDAAALNAPGRAPAEGNAVQGAPGKKEEAKKDPTQACLSTRIPEVV